MKTLTIFTPTYNRAHLLPKLYASLLQQSSKDFQWLVVDDCSQDNTEKLLEQWKNEHRIKIIYIKQPINGGKMRASNLAVSMVCTELFMCWDSDDYLANNAVEKIVSRWVSYSETKKDISGVIFPSTMLNAGVPLKYNIPQGLDKITLKELHTISNVNEANLVLRTDILKQYPFHVQDDENFITEDSVYHLLDRQYQMLFVYDQLTICEYQSDGYSKNIGIVMSQNPKGYAYYYNILSEDEYNVTQRNDFLKQYILFSRKAGFNTLQIIRRSSHPFGVLIRMIRMFFHQLKHNV